MPKPTTRLLCMYWLVGAVGLEKHKAIPTNHTPRRVSNVVLLIEPNESRKYLQGYSRLCLSTRIGKICDDLRLIFRKSFRGDTLELANMEVFRSMLPPYHPKDTNRLSSNPMITKRVVEGCIHVWDYVPHHGPVMKIHFITMQNNSQ